jgi:hypothetical protein
MKTGVKEKTTLDHNLKLNDAVINDEFVNYINKLSDSIREYYKVSKNISKSKTFLVNSLENDVSISESILFNEDNTTINKAQSIANITENIKKNLNKLKINVNSGDKNLMNFFEDAKVIFKKMKDKRKLLLQNRMKKQRSSHTFHDAHKTPDTYRKINSTPVHQNQIQHSQLNAKVNNLEDNHELNKINYTMRNKETINNNFELLKAKTMVLNDDYYDKKNMTLENKDIKHLLNNRKALSEMENLKNLNRKYELKIKNLKSELEKYKSELESMKQSNSVNLIKFPSLDDDGSEKSQLIQSELLLNKDKTISSLKIDIEKNNIKYGELNLSYMNCQLEIKKLQEENNRLKNSYKSESNCSQRINDLIKENNHLKKSIEILKNDITNAKYPLSDLNAKINQKDLELNETDLKKDIDNLKKKISIIEKKLFDEKQRNQELQSESINLKNKHELELSELTKKNRELSKTLMNKQNELLNLQKESLDKTKEIENLKMSKNSKSKDSQEKQMLLESIKSYFEQEGSLSRPWSKLNESLNRILENYKNENQLLRTNYHEKIKYYQEQLKNAKNEIYDNFLKMMEIKNKNEKEINDIKNDYDKKTEDVNKKNQIIDQYLNLCQEANNNLMNRICQINQKVSAKEMKIIQLQEDNQQLKEKIEKLYNIKENIDSKDKNIDLKLKEENKELSEKLDEQNQANEKLKEELKRITNEHDLYQQRLLSLGIKFMGVHELQTTRDEAFERLHEEIEQLKGQNENLQGMVETLTKDFLTQLEQKTEIIENYDNEIDLKKQYGEIEEPKEMTFKMINEKDNDDDQDSIKKENEQLTMQIMKISNDYKELQIKYNILNDKNKVLLKNENKNMLNSSNYTNSITTISNNEIELKKVKEENEEIKKKNMALISQLEEKEINGTYYDVKSEDGKKSNYEEEFDLKKMAKGARDKNRSQDINIDYPGIQALKEKYRELDFNYNSLEGLVKKLLLTIQVNQKNRAYVKELCKLVGFDFETTNKI